MLLRVVQTETEWVRDDVEEVYMVGVDGQWIMALRREI
jgi:hypothetical protein